MRHLFLELWCHELLQIVHVNLAFDDYSSSNVAPFACWPRHPGDLLESFVLVDGDTSR